MPEKYRYPVRRSPPTDPQQHRVYRMENEAIGARRYMRVDRDMARLVTRSVCRNYRVPVVELRWKDLGRWAAEWRGPEDEGGEAIVLTTRKRTGKDLLTLTHELAHHIHHHLSEGMDALQQDHGPQFMACHMSILDTLRVVPVVGMRAICDAWKIKYLDPGTNNSLAKLQKLLLGKA